MPDQQPKVNMQPGARVLYLSYDGMSDPLGGSQVLPYLSGLARRGHEISLISFEKRDRIAAARSEIQRACAEAGICWHPLRYHKHPPLFSTLFDVNRMRRLAVRLHKAKPFDLVHCRSYLTALVGLEMKRRYGVPFVFDMRGFWPDERVEAGIWDLDNPLFRAVYAYFKRREAEFLNEADHVVSLTEQSRTILLGWRSRRQAGPPISIIPCCVDFDVFPRVTEERRKAARSQLGIAEGSRVLGYIGSLGGNYMLGEMLDFFSVYCRRYKGAKFLFVTHTPPEFILNEARARGVPDSALVIRSAPREKVATLMSAADAGIAFKQPNFSAAGCSPTKLGEMLALEIPVFVNSGVGDVSRIIDDTGAGVAIDRFGEEQYGNALHEFDHVVTSMDRWRAAARRCFDLEVGIGQYDSIYRDMRESTEN